MSDANIDHAVLVTGLERFAGLWKKHNGGLVTKRLEGALGRELRCESIEGSVASLLLWRDTAEIFVSDSRRNTPHAVVRMSSSDWEKVLSGESHIMAVILAGRAPFPKDQRRLLMQFSMLLQTTLLTRNER